MSNLDISQKVEFPDVDEQFVYPVLRPDWDEPKNGWCCERSIIERRTKQIEEVKQKPAYKEFVAEVPKICRLPGRIHPRTPNKFLNHSRRSWDAQMKIWKRSLHTWRQDLETNRSTYALEVCFQSNNFGNDYFQQHPQQSYFNDGGYQQNCPQAPFY